jgi:hypothetical protein
MCLASVSIAENMNTADMINTMSRNVRRRWWASAVVIEIGNQTLNHGGHRELPEN